MMMVLGIPCIPILALVAYGVRRRIPKLAPPGENRGSSGAGKRTIRIVTLGESTVAGLGMPSHNAAFTGLFAKHLSERLGAFVEWEACAQNGLMIDNAEALYSRTVQTKNPDVILLAFGGNEAFRGRSPHRFTRDLRTLLTNLRDRSPLAFIVLLTPPPVEILPVLPWILQLPLGMFTTMYHRILLTMHNPQQRIIYAGERFTLLEAQKRIGRNAPVIDGIHPTELCSSLWAKSVDQCLSQYYA